MSDLWVEASLDVEAEQLAERMVYAKVAAASVWPFLARSTSTGEFEHRLALSYRHLANAVEPALLNSLVASLRDDYAQTAAHESAVQREAIRTTANQRQANQHQAAPTRPQSVEYFDRQRGGWVRALTAAAGPPAPENPGTGDTTPEQGPMTGETGTYPVMVDGPDPWNPMNGKLPLPPGSAVPPANRFPAQPQPWTSTPESAWREQPMNFSPPGGQRAAARTSTNPYDPTTQPVAWVHWERLAASTESPFQPHGPAGDGAYTDEGTESGPTGGQNPNYFGADSEGLQSTDGGFPEDVALPEPDERVDMYGDMSTPTSQAPMGGMPPATGWLHQPQFFDPRLAATTNFVDDNPYQDTLDQTETPIAPPEPPGSMTPGGPGAEVGSGGPTSGSSPMDPSGSDMAAKTGMWRQAEDYRGRPSPSNPTGVGDDYTERTWNAPLQQAPRQDINERGANTPQRAAPPIPQNSSSNGGAGGEEEEDDDEDDRREAALRRYVQTVALRAAQAVRAA